jgi:hypothetical protein
MAANNWSDGYAKQVKQTLEKDVFPKIGEMPVGDIRAKPSATRDSHRR